MAETSHARAEWNWQPEGPVQNNPLFTWPIDGRRVASWYASSWHVISELSLMAALAVFTWMVLEPPLGALDHRAGLWIAEVYVRNLAYLIAVAGGLHLYFYRYRRQGSTLKYERQFLSRDSNRFTFKKQLWDNVFWSVASGLTLWTAYEVLLLSAQAHG